MIGGKRAAAPAIASRRGLREQGNFVRLLLLTFILARLVLSPCSHRSLPLSFPPFRGNGSNPLISQLTRVLAHSFRPLTPP